ncbi:hypothetical protein Apa02nite_020470 [Actinoplanes palleronii]|uniref:Uncharacterized protein n=1 Tax=Actinoplanes palleronii TaxID=113570 RepID=A0ABQ4B5J8_9ACTN|nr:hypothetical protein Apa02nite_020470 [Actinoplanes palleronii]
MRRRQGKRDPVYPIRSVHRDSGDGVPGRRLWVPAGTASVGPGAEVVGGHGSGGDLGDEGSI